jgi:acetyl esterase/lipase
MLTNQYVPLKREASYTASRMTTISRITVCLALLFFACLDTCESSEATVESNVSYQSVTGLDFIEADKKLVYGDINPELQYGLLWLPKLTPKKPAPTNNPPLVVLVHGGCWLNAYDIRHSFPLSSALAGAGYAVWSLEYRRTGDEGGGWPGSFEDIRQGLAFTSTLKAYSVDLDRMLIIGHSAGGHLALLAASEDRDIDTVIGLAAISDIVKYSRGENSCQAATIDFMGGVYEENQAAYDAANPVGKALSKNTILLQGDSDVIVPIEQSQLADTTSVVFEGAGHFDWIHPGTAAFQLLLSTLDELFQE